MRTPSEPARRGEWAARTTATAKRSVFGNYRVVEGAVPDSAINERRQPFGGTAIRPSRRSVVDLAMARSFMYRWLAKAYEDPTPKNWEWLFAPGTQEHLLAALTAVGEGTSLILKFSPNGFGSFHNAYLTAFGHAARGSCPLNEIEYGDIKADPLFQPHRLADLAAFYRAFGLEVTSDAGERQDHLCIELEFMCVLAAKEAYAYEHQADADQLAQCCDAQKKFLREHLGRWTPAFARRLAAATNDPTLRALAEFTRAFIESECVRFGVSPGSEELSLRPVDEAADRACDSCGINNLPPGALTAT